MQMYKVFFQDRIIYLTEDFSSYFHNNYGLFYKFYDLKELSDLLKLFTVVTKIKKLYIFHKDLQQLFTVFTSLFKNIEAAGGLLRNPEGKILVIKRKGKWDLPKGTLMDHEASEAAALREVGEETGITELDLKSHIISTFHIYLKGFDPVLKKTYWYNMITSSEDLPEPQTEEEITEALWLDVEDMQMILGNTYLSIIDILKSEKLLPF